MSDTYDRVKELRTALQDALGSPAQDDALRALLDAHVDEPRGVGVLQLGEDVVYENGAFETLSHLLASQPRDSSEVACAWLDTSPSAPRLYVVGGLLPHLWRERRPLTAHVYSVLDALAVSGTEEPLVLEPMFTALEYALEYGVDPSTATQIVQALAPRHSEYKRPQTVTLVPVEPEGPELSLKPDDAPLGRGVVLCGLEALTLHPAATPDLSDRHCVFHLQRGSWVVSSSTGTLNGSSLAQQGPSVFGPGDELGFGLIEIRAK